MLDGLVLAPCDRSAIWLGKTLATLAFLLAAQAVALPAFVLFFEPLDATALAGVLLADIGICAVGSLMSAMAVAGRAREVLLPLLVLPLAIPLVVGGVGAAVVRGRPSASCSSCSCTTRSSRYSRGRPSSTSSRSSHLSASSLRSLPGLAWLAASPWVLALVLALHRGAGGRGPGHLAADLLHPRPDRADGVLLLRARGVEGASPALARRRAVRPRELRRDPPGDDLRRAHADHRARSGRGRRGACGGRGARTSSSSSSSSSSSTARTSCCASRSRTALAARARRPCTRSSASRSSR